MRLWDTHLHLADERLTTHLPEEMQAAREAGIEAMVNCGTHPSDWEKVAEIAQHFPLALPAFGVHPWYVRHLPNRWEESLQQQLDSTPSIVGEIGLDFALKEYEPAQQENVFRFQLQLAAQRQLPVSIHCRQAWERMVNLLQPHASQIPGIVIHSYGGGESWIGPLAELGTYFSFSGSCTWSNNKKAHRAIALVEETRLLIETDAPDIYPYIPDDATSMESEKITRPKFLIYVLKKMAQLRGKSEEEMAHILWDNTGRVFGTLRQRRGFHD
jgi:TatD DNase family protein